MRSFLIFVAGSVVALGVIGCAAKRVPTPPESTVSLGGRTATYRTDWDTISPCTVDPLVITDDAQSGAELLGAYLEKTSGAPTAQWSQEHIALYKASVKALPPLLDSAEELTGKAASCSFPSDTTGEALTRLKGMVPLARKRLAEAPSALPTIEAGQVVAKWKAEVPAAISAGQEQWCPARPKAGAMPDIYYAFEDEFGTTEWLFCDGSKVVTRSGGRPEFREGSSGSKRSKKNDSKKYLSVASKYPASEVQHSPKLPANRPSSGDDSAPVVASASKPPPSQPVEMAEVPDDTPNAAPVAKAAAAAKAAPTEHAETPSGHSPAASRNSPAWQSEADCDGTDWGSAGYH